MNAGMLGKIRKSLNNQGLLGTIGRAVPYIVAKMRGSRLRKIRRDIDDRFDQVYGVNTAGEIPGRALDTESRNVPHNNGYGAIFPEPFAEVVKQLPIDFEQSLFIDFGSGKGRAVLLASEFSFRKIVGIEFSPELHEIAEVNCENYRSATQECSTIELQCIDAAEYEIPPEPAIFFFYNPFGAEVMTPICAKIDRSLRKFPRKVFIVYFWPQNASLWDKTKTLEKVPVRQPSWPTLGK